MNREDYEILVNSMPSKPGSPPPAPPPYAVKLLEDTCERTGLDWKLRHVYLMQRGGKWQVTLSIDGFRRIGSQDPAYGGQEGPFWVTKADGVWTDIPPDGPVYAAKVGIKHNNGITTYGVAKFSDYKAGPMWDKFPSTMSAKCAEMLAWRKAFPGKLGGLYGLEEMAQADKATAAIVESSEKTGNSEGSHSDSRKAEYIARINAAASPELLKEVGRAITRDTGLTTQETLDLHSAYEARKGQLTLDKIVMSERNDASVPR